MVVACLLAWALPSESLCKKPRASPPYIAVLWDKAGGPQAGSQEWPVASLSLHRLVLAGDPERGQTPFKHLLEGVSPA